MKQLLIFTAFSSAIVGGTHAAATSFEAPTFAGSTTGTVLTGQDGWYNPVGGSRDGSVFTYAGNTLGFVQNPEGGQQFAVTANNPASTNFGRAQHDFDFASSDQYTVSFDYAVLRNGALPAVNNVGSFSLQSSTTARFAQSLMTWDDLATGAAYDMSYVWFSSANVQNPGNTLPGPEWDALPLNTWFRHSITFDLATNQLLNISIQNLQTGGVVTSVSPADAYLWGGSDPAVFNTRTRPTAARFFSGGGAGVENIGGWDNLSVVPEPASFSLMAIGGAMLFRRRRTTTEAIN